MSSFISSSGPVAQPIANALNRTRVNKPSQQVLAQEGFFTEQPLYPLGPEAIDPRNVLDGGGFATMKVRPPVNHDAVKSVPPSQELGLFRPQDYDTSEKGLGKGWAKAKLSDPPGSISVTFCKEKNAYPPGYKITKKGKKVDPNKGVYCAPSYQNASDNRWRHFKVQGEPSIVSQCSGADTVAGYGYKTGLMSNLQCVNCECYKITKDGEGAFAGPPNTPNACGKMPSWCLKKSKQFEGAQCCSKADGGNFDYANSGGGGHHGHHGHNDGWIKTLEKDLPYIAVGGVGLAVLYYYVL